MYDFEVRRPVTLAEAIEDLRGDEAQILGGGQTLIPTLKQRLAAPERLVSLGAVSEIRGICRGDDGRMCIGGGTLHSEVAKVVGFAGLADLAGGIGDPAVRARGTLGGSLANNDPSACYPAAVLASGAQVRTPDRLIEAEDFFEGMFETALEEGEIITEVRFEVPGRSAYAKFCQPASRFALVGVFVAEYDSGCRVAVTGASEDGVFRWEEAEAALGGGAEALDAVGPPEVQFMDDIHASADYRAHLSGVMLRRAAAALR